MGLEFPPRGLTEELADRRTLNVVVGRSLVVQLVENPNLVTRLAQFLAKNQEPVTLVCVTCRDKQNGIGECSRSRSAQLRSPGTPAASQVPCRFGKRA